MPILLLMLLFLIVDNQDGRPTGTLATEKSVTGLFMKEAHISFPPGEDFETMLSCVNLQRSH